MPFRSNNPLTRDELLSRFFPQFHPVTTFNSGLSGGSFLIEHQGQRFVVRQPHDPDAPQSRFAPVSGFITTTRMHCTEAAFISP